VVVQPSVDRTIIASPQHLTLSALSGSLATVSVRGEVIPDVPAGNSAWDTWAVGSVLRVSDAWVVKQVSGG
jgi:hypothetical protein